jgi:hypothetical protein
LQDYYTDFIIDNIYDLCETTYLIIPPPGPPLSEFLRLSLVESRRRFAYSAKTDVTDCTDLHPQLYMSNIIFNNNLEVIYNNNIVYISMNVLRVLLVDAMYTYHDKCIKSFINVYIYSCRCPNIHWFLYAAKYKYKWYMIIDNI